MTWGKRPTLPCGTRAAAQRHRRSGEELDAACLAAESAYLAKYRRARNRAKERLAKEYKERLYELYREELLKERAS